MLGMEENSATKGQKIGFMNRINRYAMVGGFVHNVGASKVVTGASSLTDIIRYDVGQNHRLPGGSRNEG